MKVIFCDVDGVLNNAVTKARSPSGYVGVSDQLILKLKAIVSKTGAAIVLSSDWRLVKDDPVHGKDYRYLARKLLFAGKMKISDSSHIGYMSIPGIARKTVPAQDIIEKKGLFPAVIKKYCLFKGESELNIFKEGSIISFL